MVLVLVLKISFNQELVLVLVLILGPSRVLVLVLVLTLGLSEVLVLVWPNWYCLCLVGSLLLIYAIYAKYFETSEGRDISNFHVLLTRYKIRFSHTTITCAFLTS